MKTPQKIGRKQKHFEDPETGLPVVGLSRMTDGRWRIIGTQTRFSESDIPTAIRRFHELTGQKPNSKAQERLVKIAEDVQSSDVPQTMTWKQIYRQVAQDILLKPRWVAEQTGIEWIAYGPTLSKPTPSPTVDELKKLWEEKATCSVPQMRAVRKGWQHFVDETEIKTLAEITPEVVVAYQDALHASGYGGKMQMHVIAGIRRVLTFAKSRAIAMTSINTALTYLELLKPSETVESSDPKPIDVSDWKRLLAAATGDDKAMVLLMINGAFYIKEVIRLEWGDIEDGTIVTKRQKRGECIRVCTLWQETVDALKAVKRKGDRIFYTYLGAPLKVYGAFLRFKKLVDRANEKLEENQQPLKVTPSQLRDGAYTAAVEAGVSIEFCKLLGGHRIGMPDKYVKRNPAMVKPACAAVYDKYMK